MEEAPKIKSSWWRLCILGLALAAAVMLFRFTNVTEYLTLATVHRLREVAGVWAPPTFVLVYAVGTLIAFPGSLLSLTGGLLFGTLLGGSLIVVGASCGAICAFLLARYAGRDVIEKFISGRRLEKFDNLVHGSGLSAVLFTRLVPLLPFNFLNFAWGLTSVRLRDYVVGTVLGITPGAFVYANLAGAVARSLERDDQSIASIEIGRLLNRDMLLAFTLLGFLALIPMIVKWWQARSTSASN
ncbi:MAG TPA: VTT domain-containing protein [Pyrinomonadaceae bacterium]|nr:VTT domain-containing protein [Pyrinomonadaceae bacterium]